MPVKIDPKSKSKEHEVFQGLLGNDITLGTKVVYTHYKTNNLYKGAYVGKITDKSVFIYRGSYTSYSERQVSKHRISCQLISMEEQVDVSKIDVD